MIGGAGAPFNEVNMTMNDFPKLELFLRLWEVPAARMTLTLQMEMMRRAYSEELQASRFRFKVEPEPTAGEIAILQDIDN